MSAQTKPVGYLFRLKSGSQIKPNLTLLHTLLGVQSECSYTSANVIFTTGVKRLGREADHSPHLVPSLRMSGVSPLLPLMPSCRAQGILYLDRKALFSQLFLKKYIRTVY